MTRICVIGGGPAGIGAALEAAMLGAEASLISTEDVGGRATWHSLVPSKVCLTAADHLAEAAHFGDLGLQGAPPTVDLGRLMERIAAQAADWSRRQARLLEDRGVRLLAGTARFRTADTIGLSRTDEPDRVVAFDKAIIATGSIPIFLPTIKPDVPRILAPRAIGKLDAWPSTMIVIGGGVTGAEFASFFAAVGARVVWITDQDQMLPRSDRDLSAALERSFAARGVGILKNAPVAAVRREDDGVAVQLRDGSVLNGSHAFIAIGRRPDTDALGLEAADVAHGPDGIGVDVYCRTGRPNIYAAGDVTGPPFVANRGLAQARVAARHACGIAVAPFREYAVIEATYTSPQVAQVGVGETQAATTERRVRVFRAAYDQALKPRLGGTAHGFVKILADARDGRIVGGGAFGERAAEVLAPVAVAIAGALAVEDLAAVFPAYPTLAELIGIAVRGY
jgi:dihydrolipoamide dehydrogenase